MPTRQTPNTAEALTPEAHDFRHLSRAEWAVRVSLGKLKGNKGSQNYTLPDDIDPARYTSVRIWCDRFDVSFGTAELARVGPGRRVPRWRRMRGQQACAGRSGRRTATGRT
jgi:hypothetical protein